LKLRRLNIPIKKQNPNNIQAQLVSELDKLKAENIVVIDLKGKSSIADYMIVAAGNSSRHTNSMAQKIIEFLKTFQIKKISVEGLQKSDWILIDAGDILLHLFQQETREFYNLEKMWVQKKGTTETVLIGNDL